MKDMRLAQPEQHFSHYAPRNMLELKQAFKGDTYMRNPFVVVVAVADNTDVKVGLLQCEMQDLFHCFLTGLSIWLILVCTCTYRQTTTSWKCINFSNAVRKLNWV